MVAPLHTACTALELPRPPQPGGKDWLRLVGGLHAGGEPGFWWLDSARVDPRLGRYSFAGAEPVALVRSFGARSELRWLRRPEGDRRVLPEQHFGDPLEALRLWLPPRPAERAGPPLPVPFVGGAVGVFGYELATGWDRAPGAARDDLGLPDQCWLLVDRVYAHDHLEGRTWACAVGFAADAEEAQRRAESSARAMRASPPSGPPPPDPAPAPASLEPRACFDVETYGKAVEAIRERIVAGDVYQACMTHRLELPFDGDPWTLYGALRSLNPAPFAAYLALPEVTLVGSSPERFLSLDAAGWAESRPIKGTRPRRQEPEADRRERAELEASEKDRAENLMIADLVRNDLGRVCETGSVHVPELMVVEPYASVFQLVSTIRGRLREGHDVLDLVRASFPPGSMTGAPKRAAMTLLSDLEPVRRGFYAGALGCLDLRGGCELSVVIRTALLTPGRAWVHTGGGIVVDSRPDSEWRETEDKAAPLLEALARAAPGNG